jgi:hypothetical protein
MELTHHHEIADDHESDVMYWARLQLEALVRKGTINRDELVAHMHQLRAEKA